MHYSETQELFADRFEFPATHETVIEEVGDLELSTPVGKEIPLAEILERTNDERYDTLGELQQTLIGNLEEEFIGRKFYDDRAGQPEQAIRSGNEMSI